MTLELMTRTTKPASSPPDGRVAAVTSTTQDDLHVGDEPMAVDHTAEVARARQLAERYRLEFVDMDTFRIEAELFRSIPADLMLRYGFVPDRKDGQTLVIVVSDPTDLPMLDELALLLNYADSGHGRDAGGDRVDPQEERGLAAGARRGD